MLALLDRRGIMRLKKLSIAVMVGDGDEEVEPLARGEKRARRALRFAQGRDGIIHELGHAGAVEGWLEPARAYEEREFPPHFGIANIAEPGRGAGAPDEGQHIGLLHRPARASDASRLVTSASSS